MSDYTLHHGDCIEYMATLPDYMATLPDGCVDAVITDPPYGTTACKWDSVVDVPTMMSESFRILSATGTLCVFGTQPFMSLVVFSSLEKFKYEIVWAKNRKTMHVHAKNRPLQGHELISVFSNGAMAHKTLSKKRMTYNPQGLIYDPRTVRRDKTKKFGTIIGQRPSHVDEYTAEYTNYPSTVYQGKTFSNSDTLHPTQKPVDLMRYLIRTYTNPGETILDFTMGSGTTGVAAVLEGRKFIGCELDAGYFEIARERIEAADLEASQMSLFAEAAD